MEIKTLASGSTGNAYLVGDGTTTLLLECGISMRAVSYTHLDVYKRQGQDIPALRARWYRPKAVHDF